MLLKIFFKGLIILLTAFVTVGDKNSALVSTSIISSQMYHDLGPIQQCPDENPKARVILESFLTESIYSDWRQLSGTDGLTISQITLLIDSNSSQQQVCSELRSRDIYNPAILGDHIQPAYYKVGDFYFVSKPVVKKTIIIEGKEYVHTADSVISILDSNLNVINTFTI